MLPPSLVFSRQVSEELGASSALSRQTSGEATFLPRDQPFVGFMRHAPQQVLFGQLDRLLRRRALQPADEELASDCGDCESDDAEEEQLMVPLALPRESPYVGFQRHAPPSPMLRFSAPSPALHPRKPPHQKQVSSFALEPAMEEEPSPAQASRPQLMPEELWAGTLALAAEAMDIGRLSAVARGFPEVMRSEAVWRAKAVRIPPGALPELAPRLAAWLQVWRTCAKLVLPRSSQLLAEVARRAPAMPVEVAWRFDQHLKGEGVEVLCHGRTVRKTADEELVVLGDAALPVPEKGGRAPYLEVRLDERGEDMGDSLNDFGFGVTASDPEDIHELGAVADEVPRSWVVDFTQNSVVLSVNNHEAAKGRSVCAKNLHQGDRVGLRIQSAAIEVFINGVLRERLVPPPEDRIPEGGGLFPVIDLYGRTVQLSRTDAEEPMP
eukprot:CAMPEP_0168456028 /NCGR_PEP_ID=MMETSP0228-20121227/51070_1 /TAXON_ID=133427 /ORGANISM="Protoceratium reticulatum, Strain CCCM 535 (=CCMP 1889)" /LENGTH=437 /DNA_ID=CAMNT_0008470923 /DNA_START=1 /DNA_END=1314 /DNA_ORIENTATION=-